MQGLVVPGLTCSLALSQGGEQLSCELSKCLEHVCSPDGFMAKTLLPSPSPLVLHNSTSLLR